MGLHMTIVLGVGTALASASAYVLPIIQNRNIWASISLIAILLFISGHMFNHIRKVPYIVGDGHGGVSYIAGGFQNQLGLETQIVAAICKTSFFHTNFLNETNSYGRRRALILCHYLGCQGSSHGRCQNSAGRGGRLERYTIPGIQLSPKRLPR